ncbi:lipopolysaccharide assembly protein LapA domain-containing protein [Nocardioides sp. SYSU DS0663]|uniref:lipopolysaccharide assembly protein LapA domain-containing protein n=1 Tax=Nocardioides sp. SYSU DS0663 TaxID=3416445 RepID=UPI003F4C8D89
MSEHTDRTADPAPSSGTTPGTAPGPTAGGGRSGDPLRGSRTSGLWAALVAFGLVLVLLVVFIAQNTDPVLVRFLSFEGETPLAVALLVAVAAGLLLTALAGTLRMWQVRRRVRRDRKSH